MDTIAVVDFGGQYTHLIANRIRRLGVYSEIVSPTVSADSLAAYRGIILSGGPCSVLDSDSPRISAGIFSLGIPVLGLCYGHQLMAQLSGGSVCRGAVREYGLAQLEIKTETPLFQGLDSVQQIWMSHGDTVDRLPDGFSVLASSSDCINAAVGDPTRRLFGLQFHPEVTDTPGGMVMLQNFLDICQAARTWNSDSFIRDIAHEIQARCAGRKVFLLVSGGVDSTVAFALLNTILGTDRVLGLHIDNGLMRLNESSAIMAMLKKHNFTNLHIVDASQQFLQALSGVSDPETKRTIIGNTFLAVKEQAQFELGLNVDEWILGQGTIYPDTIESAGTKHADRIKTHHNRVDIVLELIERGLIVEPLAHLYKDEVRALGEHLQLPHELIWRHPFPGPGLGVRLLCSDGTIQPVDDRDQSQVVSLVATQNFSACILPLRSVGVQGDSRTYAHPALLCGRCDWDVLESLSTRITNSVSTVNRVVYGVRLEQPGPYRIINAYPTKERLDLLRLVDDAVTQTLIAHGAYQSVWQMPVVLLPLVNERGGQCVVLRPIMSQEAMTARFVALPDAVLNDMFSAITDIDGVGDVFYDISHKPPGTIEWE